jgi:hypothetical protein
LLRCIALDVCECLQLLCQKMECSERLWRFIIRVAVAVFADIQLVSDCSFRHTGKGGWCE